MGQTLSEQTQVGDAEHYATPHLNQQEQALVMRLVEDYPQLDQMMAETIVSRLILKSGP